MGSQIRERNVRNVLEAAVAEHRSRRLRAYLYGRTSSDPRLRRTSTRDQESENRRTCEDNSWDVTGVFEDSDKSASRRAKKPRPDFEAMVEGIQRGECDVLVFCDSSRAYRDLEVYVQLRKLCVEYNVWLCYNGDVYDMSKRSDRKRSAQDAVQAEDEADQISERVLRTKRAAAERGAPVGRTPYGYRRVYDGRSGDLIGQVPDEETSAIVREAMIRVLAAESLWSITQDFQLRGIPCAHGSKNGWEQSALKRILINPANIGKRVHQGAVVGDAAWDPIVDEVEYFACLRILTDLGRRTQRGTEVKFLLSGIASCRCGGLLRPRARTSVGGHVYTCVQAFDTSIEVSMLDDYVQAALLKRVEKPAFMRALAPADGAEEVRTAMGEIADLESQLDEARLLVGRKQLTLASLVSIEGQLVPQIEDARRRMQAAAVPPLLMRVAGPGARAVWAELDLLQRREVLRAAVAITLNKARVKGLHGIEEGRVGLKWLR